MYKTYSIRLFPRKFFILIAPTQLSSERGLAESDFSWEKLDKVDVLKKDAGVLAEPELKGEEVPLDE